jgi:Flp pilus assembly protein TadG
VTHLLTRRTKPRRGDLNHERGSSAVELALLVPALIIMLGLMVGGGRLWFARTTINEAAQSAARSASLARSGAQAASDADSAARITLGTGGLTCASSSVKVDSGAFSVGVGTPATITSSVECSVPFSDLLLPGMPGAIALKGSAASALDTYRSRRR